jgi:zinc D-Ala-D-Ala carboxypeptidase
MLLSKSFTLNELTKSQEATRLGIDNTPNEEQILNLKLLCENVLQPIRDFYGMPLSVSSGYRSATFAKP